MPKSKSRRLPGLISLDELVEYFDTYDLGDHWADLPEAHFDVEIKRKKHLVALDAEVANKIRDVAKSRKTSSTKLINSWLKEKFRKEAC